MSAIGGPNIVEDGLVLALDAANPKSFRGEPTENLVPNASSMAGWSSYGSGNDGTFTTEFGTTGYRIVNRLSWNGLLRSVTLPQPGTYTISAWFKYIGGASNNNGATVYTSGGGISDTAVGLNKNIVGEWQRVTMTRTYTTTNITFYLISYGGNSSIDRSSWEVTMPQIEFKSYATPFVNGTRGTTVTTGGGWADRSGNNNHGELVNGPTFNSDNLGSLVFDGVDDYVTIPNITTSKNCSIAFWLKDNNPGAWTNIMAFDTGNNSTSSRIEKHGTQQAYYWFGSGFNSGVSLFTHNGEKYEYIVLTFNQTHSTCYKNTIQTQQTPSENFSSASIINIGRRITSQNWRGNISQVQIYNRALSPEEILQNYNATKSRYGL